MSTLIDRVKIFAATSGTGPFALGPNVPGFRGSSVLTDGETYSYAVEQSGEFEAGTAEYVLSTNTLVRNPLISSNGNAAVAFQANAQIAFTALARDYAAQSADTLREDLESASGASMIGTGGGSTVEAALDSKQSVLVSGTNIKTVGGTSLVGSGNVGTTVGGNLLALADPSAITFPRLNADNTVSALNALDFRTAIGAAGGGSVTSVAALTLGTTGTDLSSSVANGTSTPVITLNVPTVSSSARGVVTPDLFDAWQAKQDPLVSGTTIKTVGGTSLLGSGNVGTTVGGNLLALANPSAVTFPRFNADNTVSALTAAATVTALGGTTVGGNLFALANPSDVTFPRFNADNTVSALTAPQAVTALGGTTVGGNLFRLANPSAITFLRINANNSASALNASDFRTAIGITAAIAGDTVNTEEQRNNNTYGDLTTFGPTVTMTTGDEVFINISAMAKRVTLFSGGDAFIAIEVSGATTMAASDVLGVFAAGQHAAAAANFVTCLARAFKLSGLTPGVNTFTLKYKTSPAYTYGFSNRSLVVQRA